MLRYKDYAKRNTVFKFDHQNWETIVNDRDGWRKSIMYGRKVCNEAWFDTLDSKRL